jgi:hypothetical protein
MNKSGSISIVVAWWLRRRHGRWRVANKGGASTARRADIAAIGWPGSPQP